VREHRELRVLTCRHPSVVACKRHVRHPSVVACCIQGIEGQPVDESRPRGMQSAPWWQLSEVEELRAVGPTGCTIRKGSYRNVALVQCQCDGVFGVGASSVTNNCCKRRSLDIPLYTAGPAGQAVRSEVARDTARACWQSTECVGLESVQC
jgi:hypothetical protein